jgi:hypothetical protein
VESTFSQPRVRLAVDWWKCKLHEALRDKISSNPRSRLPHVRTMCSSHRKSNKLFSACIMPLTICGRLEIPHHSATRKLTGLPLSKCTSCLASPGGVRRGHGLIGAVIMIELRRWGGALFPPEFLRVRDLYIWGRLRPFFLSPGKLNVWVADRFSWPERLPFPRTTYIEWTTSLSLNLPTTRQSHLVSSVNNAAV